MAGNENYQVYRPDSRTGLTPLQAVRRLFQEIWTYHDHIGTVFGHEFRAAAHGSTLGVIWNFVLPLLPLSVYLFLIHLRVFAGFENVDPTSFVSLGVTLWFLLAGSIQSPIQTVALRNTDVMKTALPLSGSIAAAYGRLLFDTFLRLLFVAAMIIISAKLPPWQAVFLPLLLLPALLFMMAVGLVLAICNVIAKDVSRIVSIALTYGIFLSGVIFPIPPNSPLDHVNRLNPFAVFIGAARDLFFKGALHDPPAFAVMSLIAVVGFAVSCRVFLVMEYRVRGIL